MHYGEKTFATTTSSYDVIDSSDDLDAESDAIDCENLVFDAICQHKIDGKYRTFAFIEDMYLELTDRGIMPVRNNIQLFQNASVQVIVFSGFSKIDI